MFGFSLANEASWPVLAVECGLLSFGCSPISSIALTYLIDSYADVRSELGMDKKGQIQSFLRGVSI
jgi:hypothetical protein